MVETIGTFSFSTVSNCGSTAFSDELVHSTATSGFAALIAFLASSETVTLSALAKAGDLAEIASDLGGIDVHRPDDLESLARRDLPDDAERRWDRDRNARPGSGLTVEAMRILLASDHFNRIIETTIRRLYPPRRWSRSAFGVTSPRARALGGDRASLRGGRRARRRRPGARNRSAAAARADRRRAAGRDRRATPATPSPSGSIRPAARSRATSC